MKRLLLSSLLLLSSIFTSAVKPTTTNLNRASILQTDIAPFIQTEDANQLLQSTNDILVTTESELDTTRSELSNTDSLLESTRDILSDTDSLLEETRTQFSNTESVLESTEDVLVEAQSNISSLQDELVTVESDLDTTRTQLSDKDSLLESTEDELSLCDSVVEQAEDLMYDPAIPYASAIDASLATLYSLMPYYDGSNPETSLIERINVGLIPYLQAALLKLGEVSPIKQIAAGYHHIVVLTENGKVYTTGYNFYGQLGIGDVDPNYRTTLTAMVGAGTSGVTAISAGEHHTVVLKDDGSVWATGWNAYGQLGIGTTGGNYYVLTAMIGTGTSEVTDISTGKLNTFVIKEDGSAWGTGLNSSAYGELGIGTYDLNVDVLTAMIETGTSDVAAIRGGYTHTLVLKNDGSVWGCGSNSQGQLGLGVTDDYPRNTLTAILGAGTENVIDIDSGIYTSFIVKNDGSVWATGVNNYGQLGINNTSWQNTLTRMLTPGDSGITAIAAGGYHILALKDDGAIYGTGRNNDGQLGIGDLVNRTTLTVMAGSGASSNKSIAAGDAFSITLKDDGSVYGTGQNDHGQLGIGDLPAEDPGVRTTLTAIAGNYHLLTGFYTFD